MNRTFQLASRWGRGFHRGSRRPHKSRGQSIVEFALVMPLMLIMMLAIVDFARIYTTMLSVESAAREAADYGTFGAERWRSDTYTNTVAEMKLRACVASRNLPDYQGPDTDCTNPGFEYCLTASKNGPCEPLDTTAGCDQADRASPCTLTVTLTYQFRPLVPFNIDFLGVNVGIPSQITFARASTFAMTDLMVATP
ncbi:MAG TPA: TadE/TadG family type IV pilus assembly protein [Candidatus Limnocylindrales bacterium]|nr:TadE/TadG family type IV pilus assembly protein [Candidatus Limnocylindrales bacterium]